MDALRLMILFSTLATGVADGAPEPLDTWQDVLVSSVFRRFVHSFADKLGLDISIYDVRSLEIDTAVLGSFLKGVRIPVAVWTTSAALNNYINMRGDSVALHLMHTASPFLYLVCGIAESDFRRPALPILQNSAVTAYFLSEAFKKPVHTDRQLIGKSVIANLCSYNDVLNVTLIDKNNFLTDTFATECISCNSTNAICKPLFRDVSLNGSSVTIVCYSLYCDNSNIITLLESLQHKNAAISMLRVGMKVVPEATTQVLNGTAIVAFSAVRRAIDLVDAGYYDTVSVEFLIKAELPLPKETVPILPSTSEAWYAFLSCILLCGVSAVIILRCKGRMISGTEAGGGYVLMFLQQQEQLPQSSLRYPSIRTLTGCWSIVALVLLTGFQGALTSLVRNIPLEEGIERYSPHIHYKYGSRLCRLTQETDFSEESFHSWNSSLETERRCRTEKGIGSEKNGRDMYEVQNIPFRIAEQHRNELSREGFANPSPGKHAAAKSPYRPAVTQTVIQGAESGFYDRARALFRYNISLWSIRSRAFESAEDDALTFSDLRPYFLVWAAGMTLSTVVFLLEVAIFRLKKTTAFKKMRMRIRAVRRIRREHE